MFQVVLTKGITSKVYGTYDTIEIAQDIARSHASTGYWFSVEIVKI